MKILNKLHNIKIQLSMCTIKQAKDFYQDGIKCYKDLKIPLKLGIRIFFKKFCIVKLKNCSCNEF